MRVRTFGFGSGSLGKEKGLGYRMGGDKLLGPGFSEGWIFVGLVGGDR